MISIREIKTEEDYNQLLKVYNTAENMQFILTGKYDWTMTELKEKWEKEKFNPAENTGFKVVVLESGNKIIGECGLLKTDKPVNEELEIAYMIDKSYWGRGIGTEICKRLINDAFHDLEVKKLKAGMYKANVRSAALLEKLGFTLVMEGTSKSGIRFVEYELLSGVNY